MKDEEKPRYEMNPTFTLLSGVLIGVLIPLVFRCLDHTSLKSSIDVYNGWDDGSEERRELLVPLKENIEKDIRLLKRSNVLNWILGALLLMDIILLLIGVTGNAA